jgi:tetratricopeptide (TPR) repeat protein
MRRRWFRSSFAASLLLSVTLMFGCAWQGHIKKGDEFLAAGNYDAAATEYAEALRLRPDDAEIAAKLREAQGGQVELRSQRARAALDANDTAQAIALAAEAFGILPDHPATTALIDHVVDVAGQRAKTSAEAGQFAEAMAIYDQILAGLPSARDRVSADAKAVTDAWVAKLTTAATEAEAAMRIGSALLYRSKIAALTGQPSPERDAAREQVAAQLRYVVVIKAKGGGAGDTVAASLLGKQPGSLLEIASAGERPAATMTLTIGKPKFGTDKQTREQEAQYQSGTKQVPNPFYKSAQDDVLDEERRQVEAENEVTKQEQYVSQYSAEVSREGDTPGVSTGAEQNLWNAESRLESAQRSLQDQRNAVIRAKEKAASTPQTSEEPVYSTHRYKITTHILTATVQVKAQLEHADGRPPISIDQPLTASAQDDENAAQSVAGIAEDPLSLPSKDELAAQLDGQAAPMVGAVIAESFAGHRQGLLAQAGAAAEPTQKLELLLHHVISDPRSVDAQVVADILALSGVPDAATLLATPGG